VSATLMMVGAIAAKMRRLALKQRCVGSNAFAQTEMGAGIAARNGGRHCCQPPLRRAKDLPVFVTWLIVPFGLPSRSRSWLTSSGVAFHLAVPSFEETGTSTGLRRPRARWSFNLPGLAFPQNPTIRKPLLSWGQNGLMFRGPSWVDHSCVPLRSPCPTRGLGNRVALETIDSSGASSRLAPRRTRKLFPITCRRRSVLQSPAAPFLPSPAFLGRRGLPSRSRDPYGPCPRVAEAKFLVRRLWITGISGTTVGTIRSARVGCRSLLAALLPPSV